MKQILFGFLLLGSITLFTQCNQSEDHPPNIVLILADDLGYGDISSNNESGKIITPNIDQLGEEGIRFTDAHTSSAVCTPTRYGILTGRYNWRTRLKSGVLGGVSKALIPTNRSTVASVLKESGYNTAFIGKWHLGWNWAKYEDSIKLEEKNFGASFGNIDYTKPVTHTPNDLGFDYAYGHCGSLDMAPYVYVENGMATMSPDRTTVDTGYKFWRKGPTAPDFIHEDVTPNFFRRAMQYIEKQAEKDEPYFLYLPLPSPHTPILPTEEWQGKSGLNPYADFVIMIDDYMGQLVEAIERTGEADNTIVIFTSDNGCSPMAKFEVLEEMGHDPSYIFRGHKADIFEAGHRVPFFIKWPKISNGGRVCDQTICTTDFLATFAEIAGYSLQANEGEDSYSLLKLIEGDLPDGKLFREATVHHSINGSFSIRKGDWKLIMCPGSGGWSFPRPGRDKDVIASLPPIQLYNLKEDPSETNNMESAQPEKVEELKALLVKYIQDGRSTPGEKQENDPIQGKWHQTSFIE
ncbi:arylsulfatase [Bacteroidota bacterium]